MKLTKLTQFGIFTLLFSFSIISCKNEIVDKSSATQELRQVEQLQVQGILEKDSTIIRKILANDLIVNAPSNTVVDLNMAMEALKLGYIDYTSYEQKIEPKIIY
jgi:hypothetical protein